MAISSAAVWLSATYAERELDRLKTGVRLQVSHELARPNHADQGVYDLLLDGRRRRDQRGAAGVPGIVRTTSTAWSTLINDLWTFHARSPAASQLKAGVHPARRDRQSVAETWQMSKRRASRWPWTSIRSCQAERRSRSHNPGGDTPRSNGKKPSNAGRRRDPGRGSARRRLSGWPCATTGLASRRTTWHDLTRFSRRLAP